MKIKTSYTIEEEHEIAELSHYRSIPSKDRFYKVLNDNECIMIICGKRPCSGITVTFVNQAFLHEGHHEITEQEFKAAFDKQMNILIQTANNPL